METRPGPRTEQENLARNLLQRELMSLYLAEGILTEDDTEKMLDVFRQVSDIIDQESEDHHSIIAAFQSGDLRGAAMMLKSVIEI